MRKDTLKLKRKSLPLFFTSLILGMAIASHRITPAFSSTTKVEVINLLTGNSSFVFHTNYTHIWIDPEMKPETCLGPVIGYEFVANVTVVDVVNLSSWELCLTFNSSLINVVDISLPDDHVFAGRTTTIAPKNITEWNEGTQWWPKGAILWSVNIGPPFPEPPYPPDLMPFNGTGTLCQIEFKIVRTPFPGEGLSCYIAILTKDNPLPQGGFYTFLLDPEGLQSTEPEELPFEKVDGYYSIPEFTTQMLLTLFLMTILAAFIIRRTGQNKSRECRKL